MWEGLLYYLLCGALAGLSAGLFGVGGGIVVVPFLAWQFPLQGFPGKLVMLMAVATSLATIVVTSLSSALAHYRRGAMRWEAVQRLVPGIICGSLAGATIAERLPVPAFKVMFGAFLLLATVRAPSGSAATNTPGRRIAMLEFVVAGVLIGLISSILGVGGGTFSVPYLVRRGMSIRNAVAVSSACGFPIALAGTVTYLILGWNRADQPSLTAGYIFLPAFVGIALASVIFAPVGARLAHTLPMPSLAKAFELLLVLVGLRLVWQGMSTLNPEAVMHFFGTVDDVRLRALEWFARLTCIPRHPL